MKPATPQERNILELIARGLTTKQIASMLQISFHTVQAHRRSLLKKYDASNSAELIMKASHHFNLKDPGEQDAIV
jgi:two-component system, NarL family, response regulator NreC